MTSVLSWVCFTKVMEPLYYVLAYSDIVRNGHKSIHHPKASLSERVVLRGRKNYTKVSEM